MPRSMRRCSGSPSCCAAALDLRRAGRDIPGPAHGRPDPGAARRRRAHRRRRFRPAHLDQDRRRTGRPRQPVQRHGRAAAGILCRPGEQGRAADGGTERVAAAADGDRRRCCKVISRSPGELQPVFQTMLENATRVCGAKFGDLLLCRRRRLHGRSSQSRRRRSCDFCAQQVDRPGAKTGLRPISEPSRSFTSPTCERAGRIELDPLRRDIRDARRRRTMLAVPMLKEGELVGAIIDLSPGGPALHRKADRAGRPISPTRPLSPSRIRGC